MNNSKLMTPLFYNSNFNRDGRRMRAIFEREVSDGTTTFRLWRSAGKPDLKYHNAENDKYILYAEINGYLAPLGMTDYFLINRCGFEPASKKLYGGKEHRAKWINNLEKSGGSNAVQAAVAKEQAETEQYGVNPARQTGYIQKLLDEHIGIYLKAKENGGQTPPDFIGALVLNDLAKCVELSAVRRARQQAENAAHRARAEEEDKAFCEVRNSEAQQAIAEAINILQNGGELENKEVTFYRSKYDSSTYSIVNHLMRMYHVDVPLRTQGWINDKLSRVIIRDGECVSLRYLRAKNGRVSQKFFECMDLLIQAVMKQTLEGDEAA